MAEHDNPDLMEEKIKIEEEQQIQEESTEISLVKQEIKEEMKEEIETQITENEENISNVVYEETVIVEEKISKEFGENNGKPQILEETNADLQEKIVDTQNQNENPIVENAPEGSVNEGEEIEKKEGVPVTENGSVEDLVIPHMDYQENGTVDAKEGEGHPVEDEKSTVVENGSNGVCGQENKEGKEEEKSSVLDKKDTAKEDDGMPPEADGVSIPSHWHEKSGLRIKVIGGSTCEEELMPLFSDFGQVSSIVFDNERKDTAVIRFNSTVSEGEGFLEQVKEKLQNTQFGERTLLIEPFQSESLLFIGNLTPDIDDNALRQMFEKHGHIERAFVLFNAAGRSKCYGFVEYGLKSQAYAAKSAMGNISMDGRVLRVEWSDCRKVADMFSSVLFVDRLPKDDPNVEGNIRTLFSQYGKVRDCHLGLGDNNMFRGFAFVVFFHSVSADKAHEMLDGYCFRGHTIRVSFANPAKSPQSYKLRFGNSSQSNNFANMNRGAHSGMMGANPMRGQMPMQVVGQRYRAPARTGMMQYGRGSHVGKPNNQGHASASGMLVTNTGPTGMMGRPPMNMPSRRANATGGNMPPLPPSAQGHGPPNPPAIAQVHTTYYRGYETNKKTQDAYQHQYQQRDPNYNYQQQYPQTPQQTYQQVQQSYQQQTQTPYQPQNYQQQSQQHDQSMQPHFQNTQQTYGQYYAQPTQNYSQPQQPQTQQGQTAANYYQPQNPQQEQAVSTQGYAYTQQYNQQYGQPYGAQTQQPGQQYGAQVQQQSAQSYSNTTPQINYQQIQQPSQPPVQTQQSQISYTESYLQPNAQAQVASAVPVANQAGFNAAPPQDSSQQQAYTSYYQPQQPHQNNTQVAYSAQTPAPAGSAQQSLDAQWAAYYASQQTYQQQNPNYVQQNPQAATATAGTRNEQPSVLPDAGQKRTADQMESGPQSQVAYTYPNQLPNQYPQQTAIAAAPFQQTPTGTTTVFQQNTQPAALPGYQLQSNPQTFPNAQAYQQAGSVQGQPVAAAVYDYNKRPRF